jgi:uncharacterized protein YndB with AHSA1/START domain
MPSFVIDTHIVAAPTRVFDALLDTRSYAAWLTIHDRWPDEPPDLVEGASFAQHVNLMGRSAEVIWTVAELVAPLTLLLDGVGPMKLTLRGAYRLTDADTGTILRYESEFAGGPLPLDGRIGSIVIKKVKATGEQTFANFKTLVEAGETGWPRLAPRRSGDA